MVHIVTTEVESVNGTLLLAVCSKFAVQCKRTLFLFAVFGAYLEARQNGRPSLCASSVGTEISVKFTSAGGCRN